MEGVYVRAHTRQQKLASLFLPMNAPPQLATIAQPTGVEMLGRVTINPLIGMGAEEIALRLQNVG